MRVPDQDKRRNTTCAYARELIARINQPQTWIASRTGIPKHRIEDLLAGTITASGGYEAVQMTYPEQYILEVLADMAQRGRNPPA